MRETKRFSILTVFILMFCMMGFLQAIPQEDKTEDVEDIDLEDLLNVEIVSASKFSQKQNEAPSIISVVTKDQISGYGWISLYEILSKQPGFFPSYDYDRKTVGSRGLFEGWNNNHLLMLVDGVPFNDNLYGTAYTWENMPLFFIKSLEIIRGPGSALYGSNATNGVLTINTVEAVDLEKDSMVSFRFGNYNTQIYDLLAGNKGKHFSYVFGFNHFRTGGNEYESYDGSYRMDNSGSLQKFTVKDQRDSSYFFGKISGEGKYKGLSLQLHYQAWDFQTGHGWLWMIPDYDEAMKESRLMISVAYKPEAKGKFFQEYVIRYQRHNIDWNMMFYPQGAFDNFYPSGTWEYLKTKGEDIFARAQFTYMLDKNANILAGVEGTYFMYGGDSEHFTNTDLNDVGGFTMTDGTVIPAGESGWWAPYPNGEMRPLGPWFEWVLDKPVKNVGFYGQFASGDLFGKSFKVTIGARYDTQWFNYIAIDKAGNPEEDKSFSQFSPKLGLVYIVSDKLSIKALAGKAFRAPSPTEMFGANTWTLGSNIRQLKPEIITTYETGLDWRLNKNFNWRINWFHTKFENQIAYSVQNNNLSTNVYTLTNMGIETELFFGFDKITGFLNFSMAKRLDEEILDENISEHSDDVTWAPAQTFNFGLFYKDKSFSASVQGHYQGKVKRRDSDNADATFLMYRSGDVDAWFSVDAKIAYKITPVFEIGLIGTNILDTEIFIIKNFSYPFDYKMMGRRIFGQFKIIL